MMYDNDNQTETTTDIYLPPKRMHPADTIFGFIQSIKDTILGIGVGAIAIIRESPKYALLFIAGFFVLLLILSFFAWLRHTYRVEDGEFRVEKGVFIRKRSYISINRIHKIDFTANVLHRLLKLVQVSVDTAAGGGGEILTAVKREDARKLREALQHGQEQEAEEDAPREAPNPRKKIAWKHLWLAGMTSGGAGFLIVGGLFLFSQVQELIPESAYEQTFNYLIQLSIVFIIIAGMLGLIALWMLGVLGTVIKFGNFTIEKREEELFVKRGLLETKELTIPYDRIQAIEVQQSILRKPFNVSRVIAVIAGSNNQLEEMNPIIFPLMPNKDIEAFLEEFVPDYKGVDMQLIPPDKKGLKYYLGKHAWPFILALFPIAYFFPAYSWIPAALLLVSLLLGWMKFKETGYRIDGQRIVTSNWHMLTKSRLVLYRKRVQSYEKRQHKLQQMEGLATAEFAVIALQAQGVIRYLKDEDANLISDWHSRRSG